MNNSQNIRTTVGMSLLELLIVLTIISIIASIGYPNYITFKLETRRAEAKSTLVNMQSNIQRYLMETNVAGLTAGNLSTLYNTLPICIANNAVQNCALNTHDYSINVTVTTPTYTITATTNGTQATDLMCKTMTIDNYGNTSSKNSSNTSSTGCW